MAGAGYKLFNSGDVLTAAQVNTYLQEQAVMRFANAAARTTALSGVLAEGMVSYLDDTNAVEVYNGSAWVSISADQTPLTTKGDLFTYSTTDARLGVGSNGDSLYAASAETTGLRYNPPVASLANPVINGGMDVWQRGTSISVSASTTPYTADRWQISTQANQASTVSRQSVGDTTNLPNIQYAARVQRNSGQTGTGTIQFAQSFETANTIPFSGKAVTVTFYARAGANYSPTSSLLGLDFISGTGTDQNRIAAGYTGNANIFSTSVTLTTTWQRFAITGTVPATSTEFALLYLFTPTGTASTNDWFEVTGVQIDVGTWTASTAPTFRRSGNTLAGELQAAQRYYVRIGDTTTSATLSMGSSNSAGTVSIQSLALPVAMRVVPTALDYANIRLSDGSTGYTITSATLTNSTTTRGVISCATTGMTAFRLHLLDASATGNYVGFSAEL